MGRSELINLRGLHTNPNQFLVPDGGMRVATNVWMTKPGVLSKRRGFTRWSGTLTFAVNKMFSYLGGFVAHCGTDRMNYVTAAGSVSSLGTGFNPPVSNGSTWRTRGCIAGKNFYFNTDANVKRLSNADAIMNAGGLIAPGFDNMGVTTPLTDAGSGFLGDGYAVAYRYSLVHVDAFGREIEGPVSGRLVVSNVTGIAGYSAGNASNYTVRALLPSDATQNDFIRIFRSAQKLVGQALDDDLKLVYEVQLKQGDITNGYFEQKDITPDTLRGAFIYTAPNAGEGLLQNNEPPPYCADLCFHKGRTWFANTQRRSEFTLQILSVGGSAGIQADDRLIINGNVTLTAKTAAPGTNEYLIVTGGTASYNIEQTALNLVSAINKHSTNTVVYARYLSGPDDVPGKILLQSRTPASSVYGVVVGAGSKRDCWNPSMLPGEHIMDLSRTSNVVTATVTSGAQNFKVGEQITVQGGSGSGGSVFGNGPFTVATIDVVGASTFLTYAETGANGTLAARSVNIYTNEIVQFEQEAKVNRVYYSKFDEFDAVPIVNWVDVGRADSEIIAIVSQGEVLTVWKRDGIFRIVGVDELSFIAIEVDLTVRAVAREMIVGFQNGVVGLTDKGIVRVDQNGQVEPIDIPIRADVLAQITAQGDDLEKLGFAVAYEPEDMVVFFFGGNKDITSGSSALCNFGFIYNGQADEWTRWEWDANNGDGNGKRCGITNDADRRLYFGDSYNTAGSSTFIYKERKDRAASDFSDQRGASSVNNFSITSTISPVIQTGRAPGLVKEWQEATLLFDAGAQPAVLVVTDANEFGQGGTHTLAPNGGYACRIWPYAQVARGQLLILSISHDSAPENFELAGIQVLYKVDGPQVNR